MQKKSETEMPANLTAYRFSEKDLWDQAKGPNAADIQQKKIGDCFFVATAGEVAHSTPDLIRNAIRFDPVSSNFSVRLFNDGKWIAVPVTQQDIKDNLQSLGGSTFQLHGQRAEGTIWPAVYEIAYAKRNGDSWHAGKDKIKSGGNVIDAMHAMTGDKPESLFVEDIDRLGAREVSRAITAALGDGKRVVMTTGKDPGQGLRNASNWERAVDAVTAATKLGTMNDGVVGWHAYMVLGARYDAAADDVLLRIRNAWGHNRIEELPAHQQGAELEISLKRLNETFTRSFHRFDIGSMSPQQRGIFDALHDRMGDQLGANVLAAASAQAIRDGITEPDQIRQVRLTDTGTLWVAGALPGMRSMLDTRAPVPGSQDSPEDIALRSNETRHRENVLAPPLSQAPRRS